MPVKLWRKPLDTEKIQLPEGEIYILKERCKECGFCIEFCPKEVLEKSDEFNEKGYHPPKIKDASKCSVCGLCEVICPEFCIYSVDKKQQGALQGGQQPGQQQGGLPGHQSWHQDSEKEDRETKSEEEKKEDMAKKGVV